MLNQNCKVFFNATRNDLLIYNIYNCQMLISHQTIDFINERLSVMIKIGFSLNPQNRIISKELMENLLIQDLYISLNAFRIKFAIQYNSYRYILLRL